MPPAENKRRENLILWLYLPVVIVAGTALSIPLYDLAMSVESDFAHELTRKGPARFTRRCILVLAVLLLPLVLRALNFDTWKNCGWKHPDGRDQARRDLLQGLGLGLLIVGALFAISLIVGTRYWHISYALPKLLFSFFYYLVAALAVGVLEETLARGVIFRLLIQRWPPIPVLLIVAVAFAWIHFLAAEPEAYEAGPFLQRLGQVLGSSLTGFVRIPHAVVEMSNLALFSILLCLMYLQSGSIWLPAGFHAGAVYIKRLNGIIADGDANHAWATFLGKSTDYTDGWMCAILLAGLIGLRWRKNGVTFPGHA